jgi:hypothetical protein
MDQIYSKIEVAKTIAKRLIERNADVTKATKKHDVCLYKFLEKVYALDKQLRIMTRPVAEKALKVRYGNLPPAKDPTVLAMKLTYPTQGSQERSKYAHLLRFVRRKKNPDQSVRSFVQAWGGINACVTAEKNSRPPPQGGRAKRQKR